MTDDTRPRVASVDLQECTLRVTNIHEKVTKDLLKELFMQVGPVANVVYKPDFAFIEFEDKDSVAFALAMLNGIGFYGQILNLQPKISSPDCYIYLNELKRYEEDISVNPVAWYEKFGHKSKRMPKNLCEIPLERIREAKRMAQFNSQANSFRSDLHSPVPTPIHPLYQSRHSNDFSQPTLNYHYHEQDRYRQQAIPRQQSHFESTYLEDHRSPAYHSESYSRNEQYEHRYYEGRHHSSSELRNSSDRFRVDDRHSHSFDNIDQRQRQNSHSRHSYPSSDEYYNRNDSQHGNHWNNSRLPADRQRERNAFDDRNYPSRERENSRNRF